MHYTQEEHKSVIQEQLYAFEETEVTRHPLLLLSQIRSPPFLLGWLAVKLLGTIVYCPNGEITSVRLCPALKVVEILTQSSRLHSKCSYPLGCFFNLSFDQQLLVFLLGVLTVIKFLVTKFMSIQF